MNNLNNLRKENAENIKYKKHLKKGVYKTQS